MSVVVNIQRSDADFATHPIQLHIYDDNELLGTMGGISKIAIRVNEAAKLRFEFEAYGRIGIAYFDIKKELDDVADLSKGSAKTPLIEEKDSVQRINLSVAIDPTFQSGPRVSSLDSGEFVNGSIDMTSACICCVVL